jgi:transcriptional regulator with GAF, ATPase, and Fis domain
MVTAPKEILDVTRDLATAAEMGASVQRVDRLLGESLDTLGRLIPFDVATIMELAGKDLSVRVARGPLASPAVERHGLHLPDNPAVGEVLDSGRARAFSEEDHQHGDAFDGVLDLPHGHSCMVVPLRVGAEAIGIMTFDRSTCGLYPEGVVELADVFGKLLAVAMNYGEQSTLLHRVRVQLQEQNRVLSEQVGGGLDACAMMESSTSPNMTAVVDLARQVAAADTPVLITGETGTGKEVLANAIHGWSTRVNRPLVGVNCAALPAGLVESELFGHVRGAFSGATADRPGRFRAANGGTLFLDEIGDLPADLQAKLLRALQEGCFEPVGSDRTVRVDVRIIAATNTDLLKAVDEKRFREDLYYRLAVFPIHLPPLRARRSDIDRIAEGFLASLAQRTGRGPWRLTDHSRHWLGEQPWPGNVRELVNVLERAAILTRGADIEVGGSLTRVPAQVETVRPPEDVPIEEFPTLREMERSHIARALEVTAGKIHGPGGSAELLAINPSTLRSRMKKLGLS